MLTNFGLALFFFVLGAGFVWIALAAGKLIRPDRPSPEKNSPYECGGPPVGKGWQNYNMRLYGIALIFLIFDVEIAFVYPVATVFKDWVAGSQGMVALVELLVFIGILFLGLVYVGVKGDLEWVRSFVRGGKEPVVSFQKPMPPEIVESK